MIEKMVRPCKIELHFLHIKTGLLNYFRVNDSPPARPARGLRHFLMSRLAWVLLIITSQLGVARAGQIRTVNPDFLIENWLEGDGLPESSAYSLAQTPDGYLWIGTSEGVYRFNGNEFKSFGQGLKHAILDSHVPCLFADHEGRLWASTDLGLGVYENKRWRAIVSTNIPARSMAEDAAGQVWLGTYDGRLFTIQKDQLLPAPQPAGLTPSGIFCLTDHHDGALWLANRGFVGRRTPSGWVRLGPPVTISNSLLATSARQGGIWTYTPGQLVWYGTNGRRSEFTAPDIENPRVLMEDRAGAIWLGSTSRGFMRFLPGKPVDATVNETNGLIQNSAWGLLEDVEGNVWLGGSCSGLTRLRPRIFQTIGVEQGLPSQIVSTVAELSPGNLIVGTHGHGSALIQAGKVASLPPPPDRLQDYVCCLLKDSQGRIWTGTTQGGLLVEENNHQRKFTLADSLGKSVNCLFEDSHHRIWLGTGTGLGLVTGDAAINWGAQCGLTSTSLSSLAEETNSGSLWFGTFDQGLCRLNGLRLKHYGLRQGLPANRVNSIYRDPAGFLWFGVIGKGLACLHQDKITLLGHSQGFPASVVGSMVEDGRGWLWFNTDKGILRARLGELQQMVQASGPPPQWGIFDASDGLYSAGCYQGTQPAALCDSTGHLWFATMNGLVTVDPDRIQLNTNPPPVMIERVSFKESHNRLEQLDSPGTEALRLPPDSLDLSVNLVALSYSAPSKNHFAYRLPGFEDNWVHILNRRSFSWHYLPPGNYQLQIKACNNDQKWTQTPVTLNLIRTPYFWQTNSFRLLGLLTVGIGGGLAAWQITHLRLKRRIARLEQQRALEQERARLAVVMEATRDLVAFADYQGRLLHVNPAGRKLIGLEPVQDVSHLTLASLLPPEAVTRFEQESFPAAQLQGSWVGETTLRHRDGHGIPVHQTIMVHAGFSNADRFFSTIARDLTDQKAAELASERLQAQLLQSQKMESVGRLAGGIAHDFNNMLQVILGNADLALEDAIPGSLLQAELKEIQKSATRSAELTSQLLTFARKQIFRARELDLNEVVAAITKMLQRMIGENIQLVWQPGPGLWPVLMDPSQITQILTNLAVNARDAIQGQGRLTITLANVVLSAQQTGADAEVLPGDYVQLSIQDSGQGMTPEVMEHLFEPFFTTKEIGKGTGLGLATVFGIVKQNRGMIQVDSTPGQGTTFRLYFPRSSDINLTHSLPPPSQLPLHGTETIIVVEDEQNILDLVALTLKKNGYRVIGAVAPETAVAVAELHPGQIDLLITDIVMPGMNGKTLAEQLTASQPLMKALFMSGYTSEIIAQHGALEPGLHFLQKPFTIQNFLEKVRATLDNS